MNEKFLKAIDIMPLNSEYSLWKTQEELTYTYRDITIFVEVGFKTDFASIPQFAWSIVGCPTGLYSNAAIIHDYIYFYGCTNRKMADKIFYAGMKTLGVPFWKRKIMYFSVKMFAGKIWKKYRERR